MENKIICGDVRQVLKTLPDESVNCVITSPPYWALRDYGIEPQIWDDGWKGQLGLEPTFELYIKHLCDIFDEIKRVLRKDGTCWVNISDTYFGSSGGRNADGTPGKTEGFNKGNRGTQTGVILPSNARRVKSCGTFDKAVGDYQDYDYLCKNLCGVCRRAYQIGKFHKENLLFPKQDALSSLPNHGHKEVLNDHSPTSDSFQEVAHTSTAKQDSVRSLILEAEQVLSCQQTKSSESSGEFSKNVSNQNHEAKCLLCGRSLTPDVSLSEYKTAYTNDIEKHLATLDPNKLDNVSLDLAYSHYSKKSSNIQAKSLCGIPDRFKLEMIERGWILRNTIIWHKRNCMPASCKDRFTVDFEYVFFFTKNKKYWFEQQYEPHLTQENRLDGIVRNREYGYDSKLNAMNKKQYDHKVKYGKHKDRLYTGRWGDDGKGMIMPEKWNNPHGRNKRCVWDISTQPFPEAHFAVFPEALVEPMIKSGCPEFICKKCGKAREKTYRISYQFAGGKGNEKYKTNNQSGGLKSGACRPQSMKYGRANKITKEIGYTDCGCDHLDGWNSSIVLDPFCGSGTTCLVAKKLGRQYIGIDIKPEYCKMAEERVSGFKSGDWKAKEMHKELVSKN